MALSMAKRFLPQLDGVFQGTLAQCARVILWPCALRQKCTLRLQGAWPHMLQQMIS